MHSDSIMITASRAELLGPEKALGGEAGEERQRPKIGYCSSVGRGAGGGGGGAKSPPQKN
jgi:hypothetical protein